MDVSKDFIRDDNCGNAEALATNDGVKLPICQYRNEIIEAVNKHQFVILQGETGCGKTTQVPQYLFDEGLHENRLIGITQPRKIAAISMAKRVRWEMRKTISTNVGYEVRFDKQYGASTNIKYMTDGILLNECVFDKQLNDYKIIIVDDAHERSMMTDVLLGLLKLIAEKRADLKVIISSATINVNKFVTYFDGAKVISVESRLFPVHLVYHNCVNGYMDKAVEIVKEICIEELRTKDRGCQEKGDILVFLTGQDEIERCCKKLKTTEYIVPKPLCSSINLGTQKDLFDPVEPGQTKVVVATNIAETSITIEGIKYVIDCGYVKQNRFIPHGLMEVLEKVQISKVQANQRKGRAGRTVSGVCHRLYSEDQYQLFEEESIPEIFRKNLCEVYLILKAFELNPEEFQFLDKPEPEALERSKKELIDLGLLLTDGSITQMGLQISNLPISPVLGKVLMTSIEIDCAMDVLSIVCMFSVKFQKIFKVPQTDEKELRKKQNKFRDPEGDHFTLLKVYKHWKRLKNTENQMSWCSKHFVDHNLMESVEKAIRQIIFILKRNKIEIRDENKKENKDAIKKCFVTCYFRNICIKKNDSVCVRCIDKEEFSIYYIKSRIILVNDPTKPSAKGLMALDEGFLRTNFPEELKLISFPENMKESI